MDNRQCDIIFVHNKGLLFRRIRDLLKCPYDHVGIFATDDSVVEVTLRGVIRSSLTQFTERQKKEGFEYTVYRCNSLTDEQKGKITEYVVDKVGQKYDYLQLISLWFFLIFRIPRKVEPIDIALKWTCSELIGEAFYSAGLRFNPGVDPDNTSPADMLSSGLLAKVI